MHFKLHTVLLLVALCVYVNAQGGHIKKRKIKKQFKHSQIMNSHFTGFALYDLDKQQIVYDLNADKYFTPASNTKLFTFYTCLKMMGDSIPALRYAIHNDSLIFWATGDPSFLNSNLKATLGLNFLKKSYKPLYFSSGWYQNSIFGDGWAWNDYNDYYQAEINELPLEDNLAKIYAGADGKLKISPAYFINYLRCDSSYQPATFTVKRDFTDNTFIYPAMLIPPGFKQEIPWKTSPAVTLALLQDTVKKTIREVHIPIPPDAKTIYNSKADSVYKFMLQTSDNFIAEQLLLVCSSVKFGVLNKDSVINYSLKNYLSDLPDTPRWVDGSGLSRYNLFTPRDMIALLVKILDQVRDEQLLHSLFPAGGVAGTLKNTYKTDKGTVFLWAKTGSLSNNYNQSGYLITRKGHRLAFSFMNNNYTQATAEVRNELARIMTYIHESF